MIKNQPLFISICFGLFIFLFILFLTSMQYSRSLKNSRRGRKNTDDWLFHNFYLKVYSAFFGMMDATEAAVKIGINIEKYEKNCILTKTNINSKKLIVNTIYGFLAFILFFVIAILFNPIFILPGCILFFNLVWLEQRRLDAKAKAKKIEIANNLPRFLDLLQTELLIGMPVETAIYVICQKFDCLLSRELLDALSEMELGVSGWQQALEKVATKYDVETLSDFVLDITTSYSKGISIADSVVRKTKDIKETHLLTIKERAGKASNEIIIPVALFQFIPMIAYILIPTIVQIIGMY